MIAEFIGALLLAVFILLCFSIDPNSWFFGFTQNLLGGTLAAALVWLFASRHQDPLFIEPVYEEENPYENEAKYWEVMAPRGGRISKIVISKEGLSQIRNFSVALTPGAKRRLPFSEKCDGGYIYYKRFWFLSASKQPFGIALLTRNTLRKIWLWRKLSKFLLILKAWLVISKFERKTKSADEYDVYAYRRAHGTKIDLSYVDKVGRKRYETEVYVPLSLGKLSVLGKQKHLRVKRKLQFERSQANKNLSEDLFSINRESLAKLKSMILSKVFDSLERDLTFEEPKLLFSYILEKNPFGLDPSFIHEGELSRIFKISDKYRKRIELGGSTLFSIYSNKIKEDDSGFIFIGPKYGKRDSLIYLGKDGLCISLSGQNLTDVKAMMLSISDVSIVVTAVRDWENW